MGQALTQPVTAKDSGDGAAPNKGLIWGYSAMQGWRLSMEDAHFTLAELDEHEWADTAAFGVLDGHGGEQVARFCEHHLPREICKGSSKDLSTALVDAFHRMDELLSDSSQEPAGGSFMGKGWNTNPDWTGCTANVCLIRPDTIVVANAGDSRSVLCRRGHAVPLSEDHKPNSPGERRRIAKAGGSVERQQVGSIVQYRVNGNLNLSRSIGDLEYKKNADLPPHEQMICSTPDVNTFPREEGDEFLVIACDGVWDVLGSQDAVDFIRERLHAGGGRTLSSIVEEMMDHCMSPDLAMTNGLGGDNMTAIIVVFQQGKKREPGLSPAAGEIVPIASMMHDSGAQISTSVSVDERMIVPAGLCGCKVK